MIYNDLHARRFGNGIEKLYLETSNETVHRSLKYSVSPSRVESVTYIAVVCIHQKMINQ